MAGFNCLTGKIPLAITEMDVGTFFFTQLNPLMTYLHEMQTLWQYF